MRIAIDTETTGLDLYHGARPFLVTIANEQDENIYWEWYVDPHSRKVKVREKDLDEIQQQLDQTDELILQNPKFDYEGLTLLFHDYHRSLRWDWSKVRDTLLAGHLLASNQPHDLTTMAMVYLRSNVQPYEDRIQKATVDCRRRAQGKHPDVDWRIARQGLPEMPSAKESTWKYDMWLPRYVAKLEHRPKDDPYWTACSEYANSDSMTTLYLWRKQEELIHKRNLWRIYQERLKVLPVVTHMESTGITINQERLKQQKAECVAESARLGSICTRIATDYGQELSLPKAGNNKSLTQFCFGSEGLGLPTVEKSDKTGAPCLNKRCLEQYLATLPGRGKARMFISSLYGKRKADTLSSYATSYEKFWVPTIYPGWFKLHASLNPTGSATLRWSSQNPNEQNISKSEGFNLRRSFGPAPGREWWSMDAKNIELRLPAYESGEAELIDLFEHMDDPPYYGSVHLLNFSTVYPDIWSKELKAVGLEKVGPHCKRKYESTWYQWCKNGDFAVQYGAIEREDTIGTADKAFHREGCHAKLKARFSKLEDLNKYWIDFANRHGYVETIPDKTVDPERGYPLMCKYYHWEKEVMPTIPLNYHIQSSAMWWMMKAMIRCYELITRLNSKRKPKDHIFMVMQVHDELVFDLPYRADQGNRPIALKLKACMERGGDDYGIPTPVDIKYHVSNWAESA